MIEDDSKAAVQDDLANYGDRLPVYVVDLNGYLRKLDAIATRTVRGDSVVVITMGERI